MYFKTADVAALGLFYREAGEASKPTIVLLHGFPSSSYQFHDLIPLLADRFHVIAPDYPGMGYSEVPAPTVLRPTFDEVARVIDMFLAERAPGPLILYMHDIGGPIGMRIALAHPERIAGLIFQNFTTSVEGWNPERLKIYERLGDPETPEKLAETEQFATVERDMFLHRKGARQPEALNPDYWAIDAYAFSIPEKRVFMSRLFMNLSSNIQHYPEWNAYLKDRQPRTLIVWGRNDRSFCRQQRKWLNGLCRRPSCTISTAVTSYSTSTPMRSPRRSSRCSPDRNRSARCGLPDFRKNRSFPVPDQPCNCLVAGTAQGCANVWLRQPPSTTIAKASWKA